MLCCCTCTVYCFVRHINGRKRFAPCRVYRTIRFKIWCTVCATCLGWRLKVMIILWYGTRPVRVRVLVLYYQCMVLVLIGLRITWVRYSYYDVWCCDAYGVLVLVLVLVHSMVPHSQAGQFLRYFNCKSWEDKRQCFVSLSLIPTTTSTVLYVRLVPYILSLFPYGTRSCHRRWFLRALGRRFLC